ncbi:PREDICTED: protein NUCLEAR FUSION DEFECTIVE 6, chloroplastic/mitochondrial isoform X1 [Camelina sativa]|uniref:Protein NUCLEAR FUSION DEFECTIVE 6, chloroplastic/mitochondrial isoform X1 n=1 Tax=Camelina sativa TaxID=90675 RepID=A0ABM0UUA4_CAMSA|nr:PREDICTED: protein NUCLEAR FUSION DEFECTIVE 6, chloroplastic/mitochondrial isoform X1 [Camelina sativa]
MASCCRSALMAGSRNLVSRSRPVTQKTLNLKPTTTSTPLASMSQSVPRASRVLSALGCVETMIPLHSAVASARLKSSIAADSSCWSWLSQGFATPL